MGEIRLDWTPRAKTEFLDYALFIARDNPEAADRWMAAVDERLKAAAEMPYAGRKIPEWGRDDLREVIQGRYRLMYRIRSDGIQVLRVVEGHRRFLEDDDRH